MRFASLNDILPGAKPSSAFSVCFEPSVVQSPFVVPVCASW